MNTQSPFTIFERCIAFCFGWYFFLKPNDPRFNWPTEAYTTQAGAKTPLVRKENAWKQYVFVTTPNHPCYVVTRVTFMGRPMCWIYTKQIPPNTRIRLGVGDKPMTIYLITPVENPPASVNDWVELCMQHGKNGEITWKDLDGNPVQPPTNCVHI